TAVLGDKGIVIVGLVRLTVSASGKLALMVMVPVLEFNWAAAGVASTVSAIVRNANVAKTLIEPFMFISFAFVRFLYCVQQSMGVPYERQVTKVIGALFINRNCI